MSVLKYIYIFFSLLCSTNSVIGKMDILKLKLGNEIFQYASNFKVASSLRPTFMKIQNVLRSFFMEMTRSSTNDLDGFLWKPKGAS